jgi:chloramphenicol 3-O-phosphotransferase
MADPRSTPSAVSSEVVRATVTVALAVYLVGLLLTVLGNSSSGSSALVRTIKGRLFSPWLVPAWLDLGFEQHLTHGVPEDADHALEIRRAGERRGDEAILLFPGAVGGERAARWRRLARAIATGGAGDPAVLAAAVGRGAFAALDAQDVTVRVLRRTLPERDGPADDGTPRQAYAARVRIVDGELQLIGSEARGELAPLRRAGEAAP